MLRIPKPVKEDILDFYLTLKSKRHLNFANSTGNFCIGVAAKDVDAHVVITIGLVVCYVNANKKGLILRKCVCKIYK